MRWWWLVLGLALVVGGLVVVLASAPAEDFGWFAYTPSDRPGPVVASDRVVLSVAQAVGCLATLAGLLLVVGGAGYALGRRSRV